MPKMSVYRSAFGMTPFLCDSWALVNLCRFGGLPEPPVAMGTPLLSALDVSDCRQRRQRWWEERTNWTRVVGASCVKACRYATAPPVGHAGTFVFTRDRNHLVLGSGSWRKTDVSTRLCMKRHWSIADGSVEVCCSPGHGTGLTPIKDFREGRTKWSEGSSACLSLNNASDFAHIFKIPWILARVAAKYPENRASNVKSYSFFLILRFIYYSFTIDISHN